MDRLPLVAFLALGALFALAPGVRAGEDSGANEGVAFYEGVHEQLVQQVNAAQNASYVSVLRRFDAWLYDNPDDTLAAVEKCRFIRTFSDAEDSNITSANEDLEKCEGTLNEVPHENREDAQLYKLDWDWSPEAGAKGEEMLARARARPWTTAHLVALHERLHTIYQVRDEEDLRAGAHAYAAVQLDPDCKLRLAAAEYLVRIGERAHAIEVLSPPTPVSWQDWEIDKVAALFAQLDEKTVARDLLLRQVQDQRALREPRRVELATLLAKVGDIAAARQVEAGGSSEHPRETRALLLRFHFERDYGTPASAASAYRDLIAVSWRSDPLAREWVSLLLRQPSVAWSSVNAIGFAALLLIFGAAILAPALIVLPIRYRALERQVRHIPAGPIAPWSLGDLWYGLAVFLIAGLVADYVADYRLLQMGPRSGLGSVSVAELDTTRDLARAVCLQTVLFAIGAAPLLRRAEQRRVVLGNWPVWKSALVGIACSLALLVCVGVVTRLISGRIVLPGGLLESVTSQAVLGIKTTYGVPAVIVVVCIVAPALEELIFRGVFLRVASQYLPLLVAAAFQAIVFAGLHEERAAMPVIFVLALALGWLSRRSGGLLAPIVMHGTNNAIAYFAMQAMVGALNPGS